MRMKKMKEEKGSMAVYVLVVLLSFLFILTAIYFTSVSVRKSQLSTVLKIKETYEMGNGDFKEIYNEQLLKQYQKDGLILYYDANNNTGIGHSQTTKVWKDLSGNGNDGALLGEPVWQNDALVLDGIDDYINIAVEKLNSLENGTVIVVCQLNDWGEDSSTILYKGSGTEDIQSHIKIARDGTSTSAINTSVANNTQSTGSSAQVAAYTSEKIHIAMTWDGTYLRNYKDGALNTTINTDILPAQDSIMCYIGKGVESQYLNGNIYEVYVYNRVLTEQEIETIYTSTK